MSEKKLYEFGHIHLRSQFSDPDLADGLGRNLDQLESLLIAAQKEARAISQSKDLTAAGQRNQLKQLGDRVDRETRQWRSGLRYDEMIRQVQEEMQPVQHRSDDVVAELRRREIRDHLRELDPVEQEAAYLEAAESGDQLFLEAISTAPIPPKFATRELIKEIEFIRLEQKYPKEAARLRDLQTAEQQLDSAVNSVRAALSKLGVETPAQDRVAEAAA